MACQTSSNPQNCQTSRPIRLSTHTQISHTQGSSMRCTHAASHLQPRSIAQTDAIRVAAQDSEREDPGQRSNTHTHKQRPRMTQKPSPQQNHPPKRHAGCTNPSNTTLSTSACTLYQATAASCSNIAALHFLAPARCTLSMLSFQIK